MTKWLYKILLIVISLSFFTSAIELNIGECHQTFFDEYDTYVKTEHVSIDHSVANAHDNNPYFLLGSVLSFYHSFVVVQQVSFEYHPSSNLSHHPPKLFLRNSVWRI